MKFFENPPANLFFTGKGGVGKTSASCAAAVALADSGKSVLLVSTDPASNIDEIFDTPIGTQPGPIAEVPGLSALNVDPEIAAAEYRERVIGPYRGILPDVAVASMEEQLSGACTVEIAAFDEFTKLIGDSEVAAAFDHIIFDTAPTGHTLRLLSLPTAWSGFIENSVSGTTCLGPLQGMLAKKDIYAAAMAALADGRRTRLVLVSRPEPSALDEAARTAGELAEIGVTNQCLVINGVFTAADASDPIAVAMERRGHEALAALPAELRPLERMDIPLRAHEMLGVAALRGLFSGRDEIAAVTEPAPATLPPGLEGVVDDLARDGHGVVMTMGKGGVGKTTLAAHVAMELARRGHGVLLTTTDPAAHVAGAVGTLPEGLEIGRIDPAAEVEKYRAHVMETAGAALDADGRALLEEDLSSPCTEEIAVFHAFARTVDSARDRIVVLDTAPTGHTILLLDAAESYHREVSRLAEDVPEAVRGLLPRLRDAAFTRVLLCTLAEATPVHEARDLQADLRRAGIEPFAWVINQSLAPLDVRDPVLRARKAQETRYIAEVVNEHAKRTALIPWRAAAADDGAATGLGTHAA